MGEGQVTNGPIQNQESKLPVFEGFLVIFRATMNKRPGAIYYREREGSGIRYLDGEGLCGSVR